MASQKASRYNEKSSILKAGMRIFALIDIGLIQN
jgi:hypothetical protein